MVESTQIRKWYEAELRKVKRWHSLSSFSLVPGLSCVGGAWEGGYKQSMILPLSYIHWTTTIPHSLPSICTAIN